MESPGTSTATVSAASAKSDAIDPADVGVETERDEAAVDSQAENKSPFKRQPLPLVTLALLAVMYTVYFAQAVLMPIAMAIVLALLLRPLVRRGRRWRIPDAASAGILLFVLLAIAFLGLINLMGPAREWISNAPQQLQAAGEKLYTVRQQINEISEASEKVEQIAAGQADANEEKSEAPFPFATDEEPTDKQPGDKQPDDKQPDDTQPDNAPTNEVATPPMGAATESAGDSESANPNRKQPDRPGKLTVDSPDKPVQVEVQQPRLVAGISYLTSTGSFLAELFVTIVLAYFLLAAGDVLINNVLRMLPTFSEKRNVVELVHNVENGISSYLLTVAAINLGLGFVIALAMWLLGMPNPILWGAMAALFNFVPYIGALVGVAVIAVVSLLTFDSLATAAVAPIVYWGLTAIEGNLVTPHLLGRSMSLNPIIVFISLVFWGWLWGVGGALLAVPILAIAKVSLDQFERTQPISTLLGGGLRA